MKIIKADVEGMQKLMNVLSESSPKEQEPLQMLTGLDDLKGLPADAIVSICGPVLPKTTWIQQDS